MLVHVSENPFEIGAFFPLSIERVSFWSNHSIQVLVSFSSISFLDIHFSSLFFYSCLNVINFIIYMYWKVFFYKNLISQFFKTCSFSRKLILQSIFLNVKCLQTNLRQLTGFIRKRFISFSSFHPLVKHKIQYPTSYLLIWKLVILPRKNILKYKNFGTPSGLY